MNTEEQNIKEAKNSIKYHIKFCQSLLKHVSGSDEQLKLRAMYATWCLHRYINDQLIDDIEKANRDHSAH